MQCSSSRGLPPPVHFVMLNQPDDGEGVELSVDCSSVRSHNRKASGISALGSDAPSRRQSLTKCIIGNFQKMTRSATVKNILLMHSCEASPKPVYENKLIIFFYR